MKTAKKYNPDLILHGNLIRAILSLAIPVVINSFLQTMYNLTDTYWLGKIGTEQLAAINLVTPMQNIITNFGSGITVGRCSPHCAVYRAGEKRMPDHGKPDFRLCHGICGGLCYALFSGDTGDCELAGSRRRNCVLCKSLPACSHLGYAILIYGQHFFPQYIRHREIRYALCF